MKVRRRFFVEAGLAGGFGLLFLLTLVWPDWIELVFGVEPDNGDGTLEWSIVAVSGLIMAVSLVLARIEWRRAQKLVG